MLTCQLVENRQLQPVHLLHTALDAWTKHTASRSVWWLPFYHTYFLRAFCLLRVRQDCSFQPVETSSQAYMCAPPAIAEWQLDHPLSQVSTFLPEFIKLHTSSKAARPQEASLFVNPFFVVSKPSLEDTVSFFAFYRLFISPTPQWKICRNSFWPQI